MFGNVMLGTFLSVQEMASGPVKGWASCASKEVFLINCVVVDDQYPYPVDMQMEARGQPCSSGTVLSLRQGLSLT